jgi:hypothetical protein
MANNPKSSNKWTPNTNGSLGKLSFISLKKAYTCPVQQIKTPKKVVSETFVFGVQSFLNLYISFYWLQGGTVVLQMI